LSSLSLDLESRGSHDWLPSLLGLVECGEVGGRRAAWFGGAFAVASVAMTPLTPGFSR